MNNIKSIPALMSGVLTSSSVALSAMKGVLKRVVEVDRSLGKYQLTEEEKDKAKRLAETTGISYCEAFRRVWISREYKAGRMI